MIAGSQDRIEPKADLLGVGIYTAFEAAQYARVATDMVTRWVYGNRRGDAVVTSQIEKDPDRIVTFLDFIQCIAVRQLRRQHPQPSLQLIRKAYLEAVTHYDVLYPFAMQHETLYDGKDIWIKLPWRDEDKDKEDEYLFTKVTGKRKGQGMIREVAQAYIGRITFDEETKLASDFTLYHDEAGKLVMNPHKRFGEPLLPSGYTLHNILDACHSMQSSAHVADAFEIPIDEVLLALRCEDYLDVRAAA